MLSRATGRIRVGQVEQGVPPIPHGTRLDHPALTDTQYVVVWPWWRRMLFWFGVHRAAPGPEYAVREVWR